LSISKLSNDPGDIILIGEHPPDKISTVVVTTADGSIAIVRDDPRTAMDCIAPARMPTATWSIPGPAQNRITRSCALSFVVSLAIA